MARIRNEDLPVAEGLTPEQEELIQGAGLKSVRPKLEGLEDRQLMASHLAATLPVPAPAPGPEAVRLGQFLTAPPGGAGLQGQPPAGQDYILGDAAKIALQAKERLEQYVINNGLNPWGLQIVTMLNIGPTTENTVTVYVNFSYGSGDDLKIGLVQIDCTYQGFGPGGSRHYDATSISLPMYQGPARVGLLEAIKGEFKSGFEVRQPTLDVPPFVAEQARLKSEREIIGFGDPWTAPAPAPVTGAAPAGQVGTVGALQSVPVAPQAPAPAANQVRPDTLAVDAYFADLGRLPLQEV
jgi:hypothetical protein